MTSMRTLPHVDRVGVAERVAALGKRSIKGEAKRQGLMLAISMLDLTTLEGADTPGKVRQLAAKAVTPSAAYPEVPSCAAVCVYPSLVGVARTTAPPDRRPTASRPWPRAGGPCPDRKSTRLNSSHMSIPY